MAAGGGFAGLALREPPSVVHRSYLSFTKTLVERFSIRPSVGYYDDGDQLNAFATPAILVPDGPDGTVLLGINLFAQEFERMVDEPRVGTQEKKRSNPFATPSEAPKLDPGNWMLAPLTIMAHEFGHIMQYKSGMTTEGPWRMELHADFMAGWFLGSMQDVQIWPSSRPGPAPVTTALMVEHAVKKFFEIGDYAFNNSDHHGTPEERAGMVRAGYVARGLDVIKAFAEGKKVAGLN